MWSKKYHLVASGTSDQEVKESASLQYHRVLLTRWKTAFGIAGVLLLASLVGNCMFLYEKYSRPWLLSNTLPSQHARLARDTPRDFVPRPEYSYTNRTIQDAWWSDPKLEPSSLFVAIDDDYAKAHGLPHSQRWPWDDSKGVYIPAGAHELHCVQTLRTYINQQEEGLSADEMTWHYPHALHCVNALREAVICNADDSLMYTGRVNENVHYEEHLPGRGTKRMCRSWDKFVEWAWERSACYMPVDRNNDDYPELERYKHCPDKSKPWEL